MRVRWLRKTLDNLQAEIEFIAEENPAAAVSLLASYMKPRTAWENFRGWGGLDAFPVLASLSSLIRRTSSHIAFLPAP